MYSNYYFTLKSACTLCVVTPWPAQIMHLVPDDVNLQSVEFTNFTFSFLNYTVSNSFERSQLCMHAFLNIISAFQFSRKGLNSYMACEGVCKHCVTCVALVAVV